jgi:hypothetical protein
MARASQTRASRVSNNETRIPRQSPGPHLRDIAWPSVTEQTDLMAASATVRAHEPAQDHFRGEDFASLLDETLGSDTSFDGSVVTGRVLRLTEEFAIVDVGLKSELPLRNSAHPAPRRTSSPAT